MTVNEIGKTAVSPRPKTIASITPQSNPASEQETASKKMAIFRDLISWVSSCSAANRE